MPIHRLFDHLRKFLSTPDTLLLTCGFSFADRHIIAVIEEALAANPQGSVFAFQYKSLEEEQPACALASKRANVCVYAKDGAVINRISAPWVLRELPSPNWEPIRASYWLDMGKDNGGTFLLGDFASFTRFLSLTNADRISLPSDLPDLEVVE